MGQNMDDCKNEAEESGIQSTRNLKPYNLFGKKTLIRVFKGVTTGGNMNGSYTD